MYEDAFIRSSILEVVLHGVDWHAHAHLDILVAEEHHAPSDRITLGRKRRALHMTHAHHFALDVFNLRRIERLPSDHLRRWMDVIERRGWTSETFRAKHLFGVQTAVGTTKLNMAFGRDLAEF